MDKKGRSSIHRLQSQKDRKKQGRKEHKKFIVTETEKEKTP